MVLQALVIIRQFVGLTAFFIFFLHCRIFFPKMKSSRILYNFAMVQTSGSRQVGPSVSSIPINATDLYTNDIFYLVASGYDLSNQFYMKWQWWRPKDI